MTDIVVLYIDISFVSFCQTMHKEPILYLLKIFMKIEMIKISSTNNLNKISHGIPHIVAHILQYSFHTTIQSPFHENLRSEIKKK